MNLGEGVQSQWWFCRQHQLVVVEERPPHMIVKRFGCTAIHNKALYKCIIHSFINALNFMRAAIGSHCKLINRGVTFFILSYIFGSLKINLAAVLWINCKGLIELAGRPDIIHAYKINK